MAAHTTNKSWRDLLPVHPAAELFPKMTDDELDELGADIKKHGLRHDVVLFKADDGTCSLLDGRNRLDAYERAGIDLIVGDGWVRPDDGKGIARSDSWAAWFADPYDYVLSANVHRRHLTAVQKRTIVAKVLKAQPDKSDRQIARQTKVSPTTVGKERAKLEQSGDVSKVDTRTDTKGRTQPATKKPKSFEEKFEERKPVTIKSAAGLPTPAKTKRDSLGPEIRQLVKLLKTIERDANFITDDDFEGLQEAHSLITNVVTVLHRQKVEARHAEGEAP